MPYNQDMPTIEDKYHDIWEVLAYRIAKRIAKEKITMELIREIRDELRIFNENNVVRIFIQIPDQKEIDEIYKHVIQLSKE